MELLCALLAGFFFWLLVFHWLNVAQTGACEKAGPLLLKVGRGPLVLTILMVALVALQAGNALYFRTATPRSDNLPAALIFTTYFLAALNLFIILCAAGFFINFYRFGLEVREYGLLLGRARFVPWSNVRVCKWPRPKRLRIHIHFRGPIRWTVREQAEAVTAVLGRFVPVYDARGALLAQPAVGEWPAEIAPPRQISRRYLLQFDLQCMLLLTVVVACAASCYGIRYRRLKPQWDAVARLETFGPVIRWAGNSVWGVDFSGCKHAPTDDDLLYLEPLGNLSSVTLSGAPVTDKGLIHLRGLKELKWLDLSGTLVTDAGLAHLTGLGSLSSVNLMNTGVTAKGVEDLKRAMPKVSILWLPGRGVGPQRVAQPRKALPPQPDRQ